LIGELLLDVPKVPSERIGSVDAGGGRSFRKIGLPLMAAARAWRCASGGAMKLPRRTFLYLAAGAAALPAMSRNARAQAYPSRPIIMVVPFAAGGAFDVLGRIVAARMSEILGQQVIIENTTGAAGIIGVKRVASAASDGYTVLLGSIGTHAYNQTIYRRPRYDAVEDFAPVALFAEQPMVLVVRKDFPAATLAEFIAYVKANAATVQFGSAGAGTTTHLGCAQLNAAIGASVTHVPYRGGGPALNDVIGGHLDYYCGNIGGPAQLIKDGQVKAIATLSRTRSPLLPDVPTAHEQGLTDFDIVTWNAFFCRRVLRPRSSGG
jgi:tripartite-type tricarboxylate transporter receptor subunit TctC